MPTNRARQPTGLHEGRLSPWETLGQSLASIAPTATPAMVAPLVLAASGKGSWLAYALATVGIVAIAAGINYFARQSSSPGSLYAFVHRSLGKWPSLITGWALLIAYTGTAAAVTGGFTSYAYSLFAGTSTVGSITAAVMTLGAVLAAGALAYRDVQISVRLMLVIEAVSIALILALFLIPGQGSVLRFDASQFHLNGLAAGPIRAGLVLAIFSFVGFESAAALGSEATRPLTTIPRTITLTAILSGLFFVFTAYAESIGFGAQVADLANNGAPLQWLAHRRGLDFLAPLLAIGSTISFFACTLACITAAARTLFALARDGYLHALYARAHVHNKTPHTAVVLAASLTVIPALALIVAGTGPFDIYGWVGTLATYGFITAYIVVTLAVLRTIFTQGRRIVRALIFAIVALVVLALAGWSAFDPAAVGPYRWLPYLYLTLLLLGVLISALTPGAHISTTAEQSTS